MKEQKQDQTEDIKQEEAQDQVQPAPVIPEPEEQTAEETTAQPTSDGGPERSRKNSSEVKESEEESQPETNEQTDQDETQEETETDQDDSPAKWYVVHTYSGHENKVATALKQRIESEHLENKILEVLVPTQEKIEIRSGKKETVKEKIFPGYILVKMILDDISWLAVRTTQGVTSFIGMNNKPTPIPASEVASIVRFMKQGGQPTYKQIFSEGDTVKIVDGPFTEFIGKIESVDKERGKIKVLVSIFGRETPVELDFLQVAKL